MIALELGSATGRATRAGLPDATRNLVTALLRVDPTTRYDLCFPPSAWCRRDRFRFDAPNARLRLERDPFNAWLLRGDRLLHALGSFAPRTPSIPKLVTVRDLGPVRDAPRGGARPPGAEAERLRVGIERADHVVTHSAFVARELCETYGLPEARVHTIPLGVDPERFRPPSPGTLARTRAHYGDYALALGPLLPRKNLLRLVEAVAPLEHLGLLLVGGAGEQAARLREEAQRRGLGERFLQLREVPHDQLVTLMGAARVFVAPSLYEGFGLSVLEAMACGTPVVCSRAAALPEVAGDAARLVEAADVEALREAIARVVDDRELALELRQRGLARARAMSWDAAADRLRRLYRALAGI